MLKADDEGWNLSWPVEWQGRSPLRGLVSDEEGSAEVCSAMREGPASRARPGFLVWARS
ncbi:hypothetical protein [Streptomyces sp. NPDC059575]|uniref:hypothetical protein n=1 Tax=Streptomyces sp. NPDC059575 TaxID=3346872 RepID=UPI0036764A6F